MAQHRTKQEKIEAQLKRDDHLKYSLDEVVSSTLHTSPTKPPVKTLNTNFIKKDLIHTAVSTIIVLGVLLVTWQLLQ